MSDEQLTLDFTTTAQAAGDPTRQARQAAAAARRQARLNTTPAGDDAIDHLTAIWRNIDQLAATAQHGCPDAHAQLSIALRTHVVEPAVRRRWPRLDTHTFELAVDHAIACALAGPLAKHDPTASPYSSYVRRFVIGDASKVVDREIRQRSNTAFDDLRNLSYATPSADSDADVRLAEILAPTGVSKIVLDLMLRVAELARDHPPTEAHQIACADAGIDPADGRHLIDQATAALRRAAAGQATVLSEAADTSLAPAQIVEPATSASVVEAAIGRRRRQAGLPPLRRNWRPADPCIVRSRTTQHSVIGTRHGHRRRPPDGHPTLLDQPELWATAAA